MIGISEELIGRERELGVLLGALDPEQAGSRAVLVEGEAGVGKTILWRRAVEAAAERGWLTVIAAPAASEARLAFAALGDLFDVGVDDALMALPEPQREALEIALLRRDGDLGAAELGGRMIGVATLGALRALALHRPLVVAIDDMQWMDSSSADALRFALRRLRNERVAVLATRRLDHQVRRVPELERILGDDRVTRIRLGPLSVAGLHELVRLRCGTRVSRPMLLRLHEAAGGNPFFALEIARELLARGAEPAPGEPLPVPGNVRDLLKARLERMAAETRAVLLAAAAMARPTRTLLGRLGESAELAVDDAIAAGVLELVGERVRFTHPLLASVLYDQAPLVERRRVHGRLAEIVETLPERARHLALASSGVDERVATQLDSVACEAARRGAPLEAAELADLATRLTSAEGDREHRMLAAAEYHHRAGALALAADRAREALDHLTNPAGRARALCLLGTIAADAEGFGPAVPLYRRALRESGVPREQRADVHQKLAWSQITAGDARSGERHARAMMRLLSHADDTEARAAAAGTLSLAIAARGRAVPDALLERVLEVEAPASPAQSWAWSVTGPAMLEGVVLLWSGELERARGPLERMLRVATECQDPWLEMHALAYLSSLETHLGRPLVGLELAERYLELAVASEQDAQRAGALWPVAVAAAWVGREDMARQAVQEGLEIVTRTGHCLYEIGNLTALGGLELALDRPAAAVEALERAWAIAHRGGIESQSRFPILADAVQALVAIGELPRARKLAVELDRIACALDRPWLAALAARCRGLVAAGSEDDDGALREFDAALEQHARQERPLDHARTLLACGQVNRRAQRKSAARAQLEQAEQLFHGAGAVLWCERARVERGRIGGRLAAPSGGFSATEAEIAELVADGRTNREVAAALHLTEKTVEWNLSKIYRKLGVRSRTELSRTWAASPLATAEKPAS